MSYYGCTAAGHTEHTCLTAYYVGPARYKRFRNWCEPCRTTYQHPEGEAE